jgi:hypothetical protein
MGIVLGALEVVDRGESLGVLLSTNAGPKSMLTVGRLVVDNVAGSRTFQSLDDVSGARTIEREIELLMGTIAGNGSSEALCNGVATMKGGTNGGRLVDV